jgi:hypothetical protein
MNKIVIGSIFIFLVFLIQDCAVNKQKSPAKHIYGLYVNEVALEQGLFNQYMLIDDSKAYYLYDSLDYCNLNASEIKENFRQQGEIHFAKDSIQFAFDSCLTTTSIGYAYIHGQNIVIKQRQFEKRYRQTYKGKFLDNRITFLVKTINFKNDTTYRHENYIKCKSEK